MAVIDSKGYVRGTVGPSVFRRAWDKNIVQAKPHKFKHSAASVESYSEFGLISSTGACIRHAFAPAMRYYDGRAVGRTTSAVSASVRGSAGTVRCQRDLHDGDLSQLVGLEFNRNSPLQDVLRLRPEVGRNAEGQVQVQLPALDMRRDLRLPDALKFKAYRMQVRFLLIGFNFRENYYEYIDHRELEYQRGQQSEAQAITFEGAVPAGCMLMLSMSISLYSSNTLDRTDVLLNNLQFSPCALIGAWQSEDVIALADARPSTEEKESRCMMDYWGNQILARLPARIRRKAKNPGKQATPTRFGNGGGELVKRPEKDDPLIIKGTRISF